jgi:hypothetical protein
MDKIQLAKSNVDSNIKFAEKFATLQDFSD